MSESEPIHELREQWKTLYQQQLPSLAKARDSAQTRWPVVLDHCFARIILDNAIGIDKPWNQVIAVPAIQHMSAQQLRAALDLGNRITTGEIDLVDLDEISLALRGKKSKQPQGNKRKTPESTVDDPKPESKPTKRTKKDEGSISSYFLPSPQSSSLSGSHATPNSKPEPSSHHPSTSAPTSAPPEHESEDMSPHLARIRDSPSLTPFRKLTLSLLCQVPRGRFSTYGAMADFVTAASTPAHPTCARAVGNAMRNNPFAPGVPCHRILAGDGSLGGFKGDWGAGGQFASEKRRLLREEGVRFDGAGKVKGTPFRDFWMPEGLRR